VYIMYMEKQRVCPLFLVWSDICAEVMSRSIINTRMLLVEHPIIAEARMSSSSLVIFGGQLQPPFDFYHLHARGTEG
jgi:hypothetical protein